jgi:Uma2 family endonuclease
MGSHQSLVRGQIEKRRLPGLRHAFVTSVFCQILARWAMENNAGKVGVGGGFTLAREPDIVRSPDLFFVRRDRLQPVSTTEEYGIFAPDLAIEVVSPSESAQEVREKVRDFLAAGTPLVWVAYPRTREVIAHTPDGHAHTYAADDTLTAPDLLPGFACPIADLFA